jgi:hypothetical protein
VILVTLTAMGVANITRWGPIQLGWVVLFSNLLSIPYPPVGRDGLNYLWGLGSFLTLAGRCGIGFFLGPGDVGTCLHFQFA